MTNTLFSNSDLKILIFPLVIEQILSMLVGMVDTVMVSYFVLGGYMNIGGLIAKLLLVEAVNTHNQKKAQETTSQIAKMVEQYYMTFFGEIFLADERNWILENKIRNEYIELYEDKIKSLLNKK